jgi:uncharacterized repeat protein (TIGR03803 family)
MKVTTRFARTLASLAAGAIAAAGAAAAPPSYWKFELLHSFDSGSVGAWPGAGLVEVGTGTFWGTTSDGGDLGFGTVYRFVPGMAPMPMHSFSGPDGVGPTAELLLSGRTLYGTAFLGGDHQGGTVFKMSTGGSFTSLHSLSHQEGAQPAAALILGQDGSAG